MSVESRIINQEYLLNTLNTIDTDEMIKKSLSKSQVKVYRNVPINKVSKSYKTKITFSHDSIVKTILDNKSKKTCALVFSSGMINNKLGIGDSQEDTIIRTSTLYKLVNTSYCLENFYSVNKNSTSISNTNRCIYAKNVLFFKNDIDDIILNNSNNAYANLILSCPPSYCKYDVSKNIQFNVIYNKLKNVFNIAIENEEEVLILGAYGCGKSGISPSIVAKAFKALLNEYNGYFKEIIFSIKSKNELDINYFTFKNIIFND